MAEGVAILLHTLLQGERASVTFTLSGSRAVSLPHAEHQCQLGVSVVVEEGLPWSTEGKVMPTCNTALHTHHGAFRDPCSEPGGGTHCTTPT